MKSEKRLKVMIVISNLGYGGAERQVVELANYIDKGKFEFHICALSEHVPLAEKLVSENVRLHILPKKTKFDIGLVFRLRRLLRLESIDIVHGFLFDADMASRLAGRLAGVPVVIGSERNSNQNYRAVHKFLFRYTRSFIDLCVANSSAGKSFNRSLTQMPEERYRVVHNGVDIERFQPRELTELRGKLGIEEGEMVVGIFGSFKAQKNHGIFFRAAAEILKRNPNTKFLIVGGKIKEGVESSGSYTGNLLALMDKLDIRQHCIFTGVRPDVEKYYNLCDVTVLPSLFEGTPNVALESMASGVPVVATDVSDNRKVMPDGKVACIVEVNNVEQVVDKVSSLLDNEEIRLKMSQQATKWVSDNFSLLEMANNMSSIYIEKYVEKCER